MTHAIGAVTSLSPAPPGWQVTVAGPEEVPLTCPVVAWAAVVIGFDEAGFPLTEVQPVFVAEGHVWTAAAYPFDSAPLLIGPSGLTPGSEVVPMAQDQWSPRGNPR